MFRDISTAISALVRVLRDTLEQRKNEFDWVKSTAGLATKQDLKEMEKRMADKLDDIIADIEEQKTLIAGLSSLITGLKQQLADALAGVTLPPAVVAKIDKIWADTEENRAKMAEALTANTPQQ